MSCQVKIFHEAMFLFGDPDQPAQTIEAKINAWLAEHGDSLEIINVLQGLGYGGNIAITIFYRPTNAPHAP